MSTTEIFLIAMVIIFTIPYLTWLAAANQGAHHDHLRQHPARPELHHQRDFHGIAPHGHREHNAHDPDGCAFGCPNAVNPFQVRLMERI
jgi:hypothetical protein